MKSRLLIATFISFIVVRNAAAQSGSLPAWTSRDNRTILARFVGVGPQAVLIEKDGALFTVPFTRLSPQSVAQARRLGGHTTAPAVQMECPKSEIRVTKVPAFIVAPTVPIEPCPSLAPARRLPSSSEWNFLCAYHDGVDIWVQRTMATVFGHDTSLGVIDPNDNGRCASGRGTWANPGILGCALPVSLARRSTMGSPFARLAGLPWFTQVEVTYRGRTITVQLIDNGPSAPKSGDRVPAGIDLTPAACLALGIPLEDIRANRVSFPVSFRVKRVLRSSLLAAN